MVLHLHLRPSLRPLTLSSSTSKFARLSATLTSTNGTATSSTSEPTTSSAALGLSTGGSGILALVAAAHFDLIVTLCTGSIGFVHDISLRSALASESRLRFNTNMRPLTAARGWYNLNDTLLNVWIPADYDGVIITGFPLLILCVALLQVMIALSGMRAAKILTWGSSPLDLTTALVHHTQSITTTFWCMRRVSDLDKYGGPATPPETQPSAWHAARSP
ncbi:uncharacterized protein F5891DRAFT_1185959 [Suillus fuscotomentosus]|uniref:Uncharacterized protein n=1 Tax=Suillus fuscotomentosus TaxID=1912939 RepID=A0AAD4EAT4_9AGAM|nr:uncharacterized protein F5891DRAFT_1185959 [Suillus fuscotomentosus]KAG1902829.1 hypothetical protein F5891DRAFT_1185959 [Suillus fuscotomentosus]